MASDLDICNMALRDLPTRTISSLNPAYDQSLSAQECSMQYPIVVQELLEEYNYDFAITRVALAATDNDRESEWSNAYALPINMAKPLRVLPDLTAAGVTPVGATTWLSLYGVFPWPRGDASERYAMNYIIAGDKLYTSTDNAWLEFLRTDVPTSSFPPSLTRAIAAELAVRLCPALLKSDTREKVLMGKAELFKQRAQADALNRQPRSDPSYVSMEEAARGDYATPNDPYFGNLPAVQW